MIVIAVAVFIGIFAFWAAKKDINRGEIPDYFYGRWISPAPAYQPHIKLR